MPTPLHLFEATGVEIEYMIVDRKSLDVTPLALRFLADASGRKPGTQSAECGHTTWSNELVCHVLELKTTLPTTDLAATALHFQNAVSAANATLGRHDATLLPTAAHPWMTPATDTALWTGDEREIYAAYDHIFGCSGHGWANLQSTHLNLPFCGDDEFARLHAAVRIVLPLIPALAASSPYLDRTRSPHLDARLHAYRHNQDRFPAITGQVIPEPVFSEQQYRETIYAPIAAAIAPHDPDHLLEVDFLNSRGAIARFDRNAVEIRVTDTQECPRADLAVAALIIATVRALTGETWLTTASQQALPSAPLIDLFDQTVTHASTATVADPSILAHFGLTQPLTTAALWHHLLDHLGPGLPPTLASTAANIVTAGPLAQRIVTDVESSSLHATYQRLATCLANDTLFTP